jgi:hypothetical protein
MLLSGSRGSSNLQAGARVPAAGEDSVLKRGPKGKPPAAGFVRRGLHTPRAGEGAPVARWDPGVLTLELKEVAPLRHQRVLEPARTVTTLARNKSASADHSGVDENRQTDTRLNTPIDFAARRPRSARWVARLS